MATPFKSTPLNVELLFRVWTPLSYPTMNSEYSHGRLVKFLIEMNIDEVTYLLKIW